MMKKKSLTKDSLEFYPAYRSILGYYSPLIDLMNVSGNSLLVYDHEAFHKISTATFLKHQMRVKAYLIFEMLFNIFLIKKKFVQIDEEGYEYILPLTKYLIISGQEINYLFLESEQLNEFCADIISNILAYDKIFPFKFEKINIKKYDKSYKDLYSFIKDSYNEINSPELNKLLPFVLIEALFYAEDLVVDFNDNLPTDGERQNTITFSGSYDVFHISSGNLQTELFRRFEMVTKDLLKMIKEGVDIFNIDYPRKNRYKDFLQYFLQILNEHRIFNKDVIHDPIEDLGQIGFYYMMIMDCISYHAKVEDDQFINQDDNSSQKKNNLQYITPLLIINSILGSKVLFVKDEELISCSIKSDIYNIKLFEVAMLFSAILSAFFSKDKMFKCPFEKLKLVKLGDFSDIPSLSSNNRDEDIQIESVINVAEWFKLNLLSNHYECKCGDFVSDMVKISFEIGLMEGVRGRRCCLLKERYNNACSDKTLRTYRPS